MIEFVYPHTQLVAGVDEVGRGPLVGAVVTAAVILDPARPIAGLNDSKKLSEKRRLALYEEIKEKALSWSLGRAEPHEIDELNILHATMLAMQRAVAGLHIAPEYVLIDGNRCPKLPMPAMAVVKGDSRVPEISAASILAKVTRDNQLVTLTASRDLRFLLQEVLEKQMTSRGYMIGPNGAVDLQIIVNKLYADVSQGNVRYNIATKADIAIIATAANGTKMTKNYRASYSVEGAFQASNKNIADAVNSVLTDTIADMAQDTSIHDFIKQNAR